jgi:hypothetical protein
MDIKDTTAQPAEDEVGVMVIHGGNGGNTWDNYLQPGGPPPDAHDTHAVPTIGKAHYCMLMTHPKPRLLWHH